MPDPVPATAGQTPSRLGIVVPLTVLSAVLAWRFFPAQAGWWASGIAVWTALLVGAFSPASTRANLPATALIALLVAAAGLAGDRIWLCEATCQGGGHYRTLFAIDVRWFAGGGCLLWALAALIDRRRDQASPVSALLTWALLGATIYFIHVGWRLNLTCGQCLAFHTAIVAGAVGALRDAFPFAARLLVVVLVFLGLHFAYHPAVVPDLAPVPMNADAGVTAFLGAGRPAPAAPALTGDEAAALQRADAGRTLVLVPGVDPPLRLELALDFHCPVCAKVWPALRAAFAAAPQVPAGRRLELVHRVVMRPSDPSTGELARYAAAAAMVDGKAYLALLQTGLGLGQGVGWTEFRPRLKEVTDPATIEQALAAHPTAVDRLIADDARALAQFLYGAGTPQMILRDGVAGRELVRFAGDFDPAAVKMAVASVLMPTTAPTTAAPATSP